MKKDQIGVLITIKTSEFAHNVRGMLQNLYYSNNKICIEPKLQKNCKYRNSSVSKACS